MIETHLTILWQTEPDAPLPMNGFFEANVHAFNNGDITIMNCALPKGVSRDIEVFSSWAQFNHWNRPKISNDLIEGQIIHWKHYWDTYLLDSDLLDKKFGKKDTNQFPVDSDNQDMSNYLED